jgi:putative CocE/NonD family hydrolase
VKLRLFTPPVLLTSLALLVAFVGWRFFVSRTSSAFVRAHYTKREYRIPMRDGVKLFTQVYAPKDSSQPHPFLIMRTPFSVAPYGDEAYRRLLGPSESFDKAGYIFVFQDVRGRFQSEGQFVDMHPHREQPGSAEADESRDMADTVDWLLKNVPGNNGRVGIWGISYPGFYTSASIIDSHPAIKAASPEAPVTNLFEGDDAYHNGAFMLAAQFQLYSSYFKPRLDGPEYPLKDLRRFDYGTNDGYSFFMQHGPDLKSIAALIHNPSFDEKMQHSTYDDFWQARDISPHLRGIHSPVLNVGGWFDAEDLAGTLRTYNAIAEQNPGLQNVLVMGPWMHGAWVRANTTNLGPLSLHENTSAFFRDQIAFPFFEYYLKDKPAPDLPAAFVYETGSNRWMRYGAWPPPDSVEKTLYLHAGGKLSFAAPADGEPAFDQYISDPRHPVPYMEKVPTELGEEFMFGDQRFASRRADVLTFISDPLTEDLTLVGPVSPRLQVSTSGTDSDFDVKLIDVYPHAEPTPGYQLLVRGEPMRAKFRNSFSKPEAMLPDQVTALNFDMPDVNHTFLRGHRIMVQVASSWFPLTDLNPQRFEDIAAALPIDFVTANERVYHGQHAASGIVVHLLPVK